VPDNNGESVVQESNRFDSYSPYLLDLRTQLDLLWRYNQLYWDHRLTDEQLAAVETSSDHSQRVDDLEILHVEGNSLQDTFWMWWQVLRGEQPDSGTLNPVGIDPERLRLCSSNTRAYKSGIHRIRLNLVAHWELYDGRTIREVRDQAKASGEILAGTEILSAYGILSDLLRQNDGLNMPYAELAALESTFRANEPWSRGLGLRWSEFGRGRNTLVLCDFWAGDAHHNWAAPVLNK
jgi:hypothetical protein